MVFCKYRIVSVTDTTVVLLKFEIFPCSMAVDIYHGPPCDAYRNIHTTVGALLTVTYRDKTTFYYQHLLLIYSVLL